LRRIIADDKEIKDKCFIIESTDISIPDKNFLSKYGNVLNIGIQQFCQDISTAHPVVIEKDITKYKFKSFIKTNHKTKYEAPNDKDIFEMFFLGSIAPKLFHQNLNDKFSSIVNRTKIINVISKLENEKSIIVHSDLGNGKTFFIEQLIYLISDMSIYYYKDIIRGFFSEVRILRRKNLVRCQVA
jgi:hypothetical protein